MADQRTTPAFPFEAFTQRISRLVSMERKAIDNPDPDDDGAAYRIHREELQAAVDAYRALEAACRQARADHDALLRFAGCALAESRLDEIGDWEGGAVQRAMEEHGLLVPTRRRTPCRSEEGGCRCTEYAGSDEEVWCYQFTDLGLRAIVALRQWEGELVPTDSGGSRV